MALPPGLAKKIADAKAQTQADMIRAGKGTVLIKRCFAEEGHKGYCFKLEAVVVASANKTPVPLDAETQQPIYANAVGDNVSYIQNFTSQPETAPGNAKGVLLAILNLKDEAWPTDPAEVEKEWDALTGKGNPLRGMLVDYETRATVPAKGKRKGLETHFVNFFYNPDNTSEAITRRRGELDGAQKA